MRTQKSVPAYLAYLLFRLVHLPFYFLPFRLFRKYCQFLAALIYLLSSKHRRIVLKNIQKSFPHKNLPECKKILWQNMRYTGELLAYTFLIPRIDQKWLDANCIMEPSAREYMMAQSEKPFIIISGHFGLWEICGKFFASLHSGKRQTLAVVYLPPKNEYVHRWLVNLRVSNKFTLIQKGNPQEIVAWLGQGNWIGLMADQRTQKHYLETEFMGRASKIITGPAWLALDLNVDLAYVGAVFENEKINFRFKKIPLAQFTGSKEERMRDITLAWLRALEQDIADYPAQYFWLHNRWK